MLKFPIIALAVLFLAACAGKSSTDTNTSATSSNGTLSVSAAFTPDPPAQGSESITVTVQDASGSPVRGAIVKIATTMPAMSMKGPDLSAKDNGDGTYTATTKLNYGTKWSFTIAANSGGQHGSTTIEKDVP